MVLITGLVLCLLMQGQHGRKKNPTGPSDPPRFYLIRQVNLTAPKNETKISIPEAVQNWSGWSYLDGKSATFPAEFPVDRGWNSLLAPIQGKLAPATASPWKVKVIVFRSTDGLLTHKSGLKTQLRNTIEERRLQESLESLVRAKRVLESQSSDQLHVELSIQQDQKPFIYDCQADQLLDNPPPYNVGPYLRPRVNGGKFVADDQIYRGPYNQIIVIWPMATHAEESLQINGMPVTCISTVVGPMNLGMFTTRILAAFDQGINFAMRAHGYRFPVPVGHAGAIVNPFLRGGLPISTWASLNPVSGSEYEHAQRMEAMMIPDFELSMVGKAPVTSNCKMSIVRSRHRGDVLRVQLNELHRRGGFVLPLSSDQSLAQMSSSSNHFLTFWMKTASLDPLHIGVFENGQMNLASLGDGAEGGISFDVPPDNLWHLVSVDLSKISSKNGTPTSIYIGADPSLAAVTKRSYLAVVDRFSDFSLTNEVLPKSVALRIAPPRKSWSDALNIRKLAPSADTPDGAKLFSAALQSESDVVKLNALDVLGSVKAPVLVDPIIGSFVDIDPRIEEVGAKALIFQGTSPCIAFLRMELAHGPSSRAKAAAALALSQLKDPSLDASLSTTISLDSWYARMEGIKALYDNGGPQAQSLIASFLSDPDPEVRLTAVRHISLLSEKELKKVLFNSVNDPSDEVRSTACEKVLESSFSDLQNQGLRGFQDDSWVVRANMLKWAKDHPIELIRPAVIADLSSPVPEVRALAVEVLGDFSETPTLSELSPVLNERHPLVLHALMQLSTKKLVKYPENSLELWQKSTDITVANWAKGASTN